MAKLEALKKRIKERSNSFNMGGQGNEEDKSEVDEMATRLEKLELPEETKTICDRELKKLK